MANKEELLKKKEHLSKNITKFIIILVICFIAILASSVVYVINVFQLIDLEAETILPGYEEAFALATIVFTIIEINFALGFDGALFGIIFNAIKKGKTSRLINKITNEEII